MMPQPIFFAAPAELRAWLEEHHGELRELWVGFHKKATGQPSVTWPEAVDQALCFGWIDGVRKSIDAERYTIRFTPRKARSTWSTVNIQRVAVLTSMKLMRPAGLAAFAQRGEERSGVYSYEQKHELELGGAYEPRLRADAAAWAFFQGQPAWYRRAAIHWVMSAKKEETQERRLATLIKDSAAGRTVAPLTRPTGTPPS